MASVRVARSEAGAKALWVAALVVVLPAAGARAAPPKLPSLPAQKCVLDEARALDAAGYGRLEAICEALDQSGAGQLAVAVVSDLREMERDEFANELFKQWKLGHKGRDDGLLIVLKVGPAGQRAIKVEVGYGLEGALPDGKVGSLIDQLALPALKTGAWSEGLVPLAEALASAARAENVPGVVERRAKEKAARDAAGQDALGTGAFIGIGWVIWLVMMIALRVRKSLPGMVAKGVGAAGGAGSILGALVMGGPIRGGLSVFALVVVGLGALAYWAIARHRCPKCGKWLEISSTTLQSATYTHDGQEEITQRCSACKYVNRYTRRIPRKTVSSSSSSGGGSSSSGGSSGFSGGGGGSSGGGGAGRSF